MKKDVQAQEKQIDELEEQLVIEALKLPNKTHPDTPIGDETRNEVMRIVESTNNELLPKN